MKNKKTTQKQTATTGTRAAVENAIALAKGVSSRSWAESISRSRSQVTKWPDADEDTLEASATKLKGNRRDHD